MGGDGMSGYYGGYLTRWLNSAGGGGGGLQEWKYLRVASVSVALYRLHRQSSSWSFANPSDFRE